VIRAVTILFERASQLIPKPGHLTWEEAACNPLCAGTAYRMLVSTAGARVKQGDVVLVWGAAGGLGGYAVQFVRNGGGIPIGVVSSERSAEAARRLGSELVINRTEIGLGAELPANPDEVLAAGRRLGKVIRGMVGRDPDIVFEHVGRATFGISARWPCSAWPLRRVLESPIRSCAAGSAHHDSPRCVPSLPPGRPAVW